MFDVADGAIRIDGQDIRDVTQESLRRAIGVVGQDTSLLHRSVRENIKYGRLAATRRRDDRGGEAGQRARRGHGPRRSRGPRAATTPMSASAASSSRAASGSAIALARVILKDAPILVLDEATSRARLRGRGGDPGHALSLMQGKTVIAIAHRLSTIARMDRIVVLDGGQIVEEGSHGGAARPGRPLRPALGPAVRRLPRAWRRRSEALRRPHRRLRPRRGAAADRLWRFMRWALAGAFPAIGSASASRSPSARPRSARRRWSAG